MAIDQKRLKETSKDSGKSNTNLRRLQKILRDSEKSKKTSKIFLETLGDGTKLLSRENNALSSLLTTLQLHDNDHLFESLKALGLYHLMLICLVHSKYCEHPK